MELTELTAKLTECQKELGNMGAFGGYLFDSNKLHGAEMTVQMRNNKLPKGQAVYDTATYPDMVVKNVVIGGVAFFALLDLEEAYKEGVTDYWGVLN